MVLTNAINPACPPACPLPPSPTTLRPRWQEARPRSAILTWPLVPWTKMLSHLRSLGCVGVWGWGWQTEKGERWGGGEGKDQEQRLPQPQQPRQG